jgi:hypothetical protein
VVISCPVFTAHCPADRARCSTTRAAGGRPPPRQTVCGPHALGLVQIKQPAAATELAAVGEPP